MQLHRDSRYDLDWEGYLEHFRDLAVLIWVVCFKNISAKVAFIQANAGMVAHIISFKHFYIKYLKL